MTVEGVVRGDRTAQLFSLPPSHQPCLLQGLGALSPTVPLLAQAYLPLVAAFRKHGPRGRYSYHGNKGTAGRRTSQVYRGVLHILLNVFILNKPSITVINKD